MKSLLSLSALVLVSTLLGCAPEVAVGCSSDGDCASRCETDDKFPGGLCTLTCNSNQDCPGGTMCVDVLDGRDDENRCLVECSSMQQCRDFGSGYICKDKKDVHGEQQLVCLGD